MALDLAIADLAENNDTRFDPDMLTGNDRFSVKVNAEFDKKLRYFLDETDFQGVTVNIFGCFDRFRSTEGWGEERQVAQLFQLTIELLKEPLRGKQ